jgi:hypothetical protein
VVGRHALLLVAVVVADGVGAVAADGRDLALEPLGAPLEAGLDLVANVEAALGLGRLL